MSWRLDPSTTAIVCVECQEGVLGQESILPDLAAAAAPMIGSIARLLDAARAAGATVAHATYEGALGASDHGPAPLWRALGAGAGWKAGDAATQVLPELLGPGDLVLPRHHGLNPSAGTELLPVLRARGARTLVLAGVSLNVALILLAGDAAQQGFSVVVPSDAVAATPAEYAEPLLAYSMRMLAKVTTVEQVVAALAPVS
ncbi:MAG TPA: isochorismatase family protein [Marmoricola sp.]|jgi:nicotinamidase-related amidase|nr:isochorismatase family protein [Marmoricola sp.]